MRRCERGIHPLDVVGRLADDFEVSDDGVLHQLAGGKPGCIHARSVSLDACHRLQDVPQVIGHPPRFVHTGTACCSTACRKLAGSALGVSTSTGTPSSCSNST